MLLTSAALCLRPCRPKVLDLCFKDAEKLARVKSDPRVYTGQVRIGTGLQFLNTSLAIQANLAEYRFPFIVFHGTADKVSGRCTCLWV